MTVTESFLKVLASLKLSSIVNLKMSTPPEEEGADQMVVTKSPPLEMDGLVGVPGTCRQYDGN